MELDFWTLRMDEDAITYILKDYKGLDREYYISLGYGMHGDTTIPPICGAV